MCSYFNIIVAWYVLELDRAHSAVLLLAHKPSILLDTIHIAIKPSRDMKHIMMKSWEAARAPFGRRSSYFSSVSTSFWRFQFIFGRFRMGKRLRNAPEMARGKLENAWRYDSHYMCMLVLTNHGRFDGHRARC